MASFVLDHELDASVVELMYRIVPPMQDLSRKKSGAVLRY